MPVPRSALSLTALAMVSPAAPAQPLATAAGGLVAPSPEAAGATPAPGGYTALLQTADELVREVATLRGLPAKTAVARGVLSREKIVEKLRARIEKSTRPGGSSRVGVLKRLGLLPGDMNYEKTLFELLADRVAGFYDPPKPHALHRRLAADADAAAGAGARDPACAGTSISICKKYSAHSREGAMRSLPLGGRRRRRYGRHVGAPRPAPAPIAARAVGNSKLGKQMMYLTMGLRRHFRRLPWRCARPWSSPTPPVWTSSSPSRRRGWGRVNELFRDPPDSTEQIIHRKIQLARVRCALWLPPPPTR